MKKKAICLSLFTNILFAQDTTLVKGIALPELNYVLYRDYDNKIVPFVEGEDNLILEIEGAKATPKTWGSKGNEYRGYYVNVSPEARKVRITLKGLKQNLDTISYGEYEYYVKPFPKPQVLNSSISKVSGAKVKVALGPDIPFFGSVNFEITGGEVTVGNVTTPFLGDIISPTLVTNASPGSFVIVDVFYTRNGIKGVPISAKLKVHN
jgi:hypothetical protein